MIAIPIVLKRPVAAPLFKELPGGWVRCLAQLKAHMNRGYVIHRYSVAKLWTELDTAGDSFGLLVKTIPKSPGDPEHLNGTVRLEEDPQSHFTSDAGRARLRGELRARDVLHNRRLDRGRPGDTRSDRARRRRRRGHVEARGDHACLPAASSSGRGANPAG